MTPKGYKEIMREQSNIAERHIKAQIKLMNDIEAMSKDEAIAGGVEVCPNCGAKLPETFTSKREFEWHNEGNCR
jgi:copper oxidase (laccase) domain-containing protein